MQRVVMRSWVARALVASVLLMACAGDETTPTETAVDTGTPTTDTDDTDTPDPVDRAKVILGLAGDPAAGGPLYSQYCQGCHGSTGMGTNNGPSLLDRLQTIDRAQIVDVLLNGKGRMAAYDVLSDQQIADLTAYVEDSFGPSSM